MLNFSPKNFFFLGAQYTLSNHAFVTEMFLCLRQAAYNNVPFLFTFRFFTRMAHALDPYV